MKTEQYKQTIDRLFNLIPALDEPEARKIIIEGINKFNELVSKYENLELLKTYKSPLPSYQIKVSGNTNHTK